MPIHNLGWHNAERMLLSSDSPIAYLERMYPFNVDILNATIVCTPAPYIVKRSMGIRGCDRTRLKAGDPDNLLLPAFI